MVNSTVSEGHPDALTEGLNLLLNGLTDAQRALFPDGLTDTLRALFPDGLTDALRALFPDGLTDALRALFPDGLTDALRALFPDGLTDALRALFLLRTLLLPSLRAFLLRALPEACEAKNLKTYVVLGFDL